jgi:hypothetical protein
MCTVLPIYKKLFMNSITYTVSFSDSPQNRHPMKTPKEYKRKLQRRQRKLRKRQQPKPRIKVAMRLTTSPPKIME